MAEDAHAGASRAPPPCLSITHTHSEPLSQSPAPTDFAHTKARFERQHARSLQPPPSLLLLDHPTREMKTCAGDAEKVGWYQGLVRRVKQLKRQVLVLYYAVQDPRVGCLPRALALAAVSCAHHSFAVSLSVLTLRSR